jgi:hypothetical protein
MMLWSSSSRASRAFQRYDKQLTPACHTSRGTVDLAAGEQPCVHAVNCSSHAWGDVLRGCCLLALTGKPCPVLSDDS